MNKNKLKQLIYKTGIIPVVRAASPEQAMKIMEAIRKGGINIIEITMTVPGAIEVIKELNIKYKNNPEIIIGAGSVLDSETTRNAILAGAEFIVNVPERFLIRSFTAKIPNPFLLLLSDKFEVLKPLPSSSITI